MITKDESFCCGIFLLFCMRALAGGETGGMLQTKQPEYIRIAVWTGQHEPIEQYINDGRDPEAVDDGGFTMLSRSCISGSIPLARIVLRKANPETEVHGKRPLMWAAYQGHNSIVEELLANKADIDAQASTKKTALMFAAQQGRLSVVQLLTQHKADIFKKDESGLTARQIAQKHKRTKVAAFLEAEEKQQQETIQRMELAKEKSSKANADNGVTKSPKEEKEQEEDWEESVRKANAKNDEIQKQRTEEKRNAQDDGYELYNAPQFMPSEENGKNYLTDPASWCAII